MIKLVRNVKQAILIHDDQDKETMVFALNDEDARNLVHAELPNLDISKWSEFKQDQRWPDGLPFDITVVVVTPDHPALSAISWYLEACKMDPEFKHEFTFLEAVM